MCSSDLEERTVGDAVQLVCRIDSHESALVRACAIEGHHAARSASDDDCVVPAAGVNDDVLTLADGERRRVEHFDVARRGFAGRFRGLYALPRANAVLLNAFEGLATGVATSTDLLARVAGADGWCGRDRTRRGEEGDEPAGQEPEQLAT